MPHNDPEIGLVVLGTCHGAPVRDCNLFHPSHPDRIVDVAELVDVFRPGRERHFEERRLLHLPHLRQHEGIGLGNLVEMLPAARLAAVACTHAHKRHRRRGRACPRHSSRNPWGRRPRPAPASRRAPAPSAAPSYISTHHSPTGFPGPSAPPDRRLPGDNRKPCRA